MCLGSGAAAARIGFQRDFYRLQLDARRRRQTQREWLKDWMHGGAFVRRARWWISVSQASSSPLPTNRCPRRWHGQPLADDAVVGVDIQTDSDHSWRGTQVVLREWFEKHVWFARRQTCMLFFHPHWQFSIAVNGLSVPRCAEVRPKWTVSRVGLKPAREPGAVASPNRSQLVPTSSTRLVSP